MNRKIGLFVCLHGNEQYGLKVSKKISNKNVKTIIGNPLAIEKNIRFIDEDLNRVFPGEKNGNYETKRAFELNGKLKNFDLIIDLHSSKGEIPLFGIITKPNKEKIELAKKLGLNKLIIMIEKFAQGKSLIDNHPLGISLEIGPHDKKENIQIVLEKIQGFLKEKRYTEKMEIYEIYDILEIEEDKKDVLNYMKNFEEVKAGDSFAKGQKEYISKENFFPVFAGESSYKKILCLKAKKLKGGKFIS